MVSHAPLFKITKKQKDIIIAQGLVHFTNHSNALLILDDGLKGRPADMGFPETLLGNMVWTYINEGGSYINECHSILLKKSRAKDNPERYGTCLFLKGFSDKELNCMYTRYGIFNDHAIVYRGERLLPAEIEMKEFV